MILDGLRSAEIGRVNLVAPAAVVLTGFGIFLSANRWIGAGVALGAVLALINGLLLSRRVDIAADTGDIGRALLVMQFGLVITFTVVGVATVIVIHFSLAMAVACAAGFAVSHVAMLTLFYLTRARTGPTVETEAL
jgi:hypothetical protein